MAIAILQISILFLFIFLVWILSLHVYINNEMATEDEMEDYIVISVCGFCISGIGIVGSIVWLILG